MPEIRVPLADVRLEEADIAAIADTYRSGWLSLGPRTQEFETAFADFVGAEHALATSSCTAALHLMCLAVGLGPGDEVVVPAMTFVATVNSVTYTGARPVFADIESLEEPWMSARTIEAAITPRTRAIMYMAYGGHPARSEEVRALAEERGLMLLEDAAHAIGTRVGGRHLGTLGAAGAFSFFSNKNLAVGEGGMFVTSDAELAGRVRALRSHGMTSLSWDRHKGHAFGYDVVALGLNYRIDEPRAALGVRRLARLDEENAARRVLDAAYRERLAGMPGVVLPVPAGDGDMAAHHVFTLALPPGTDRDALRTHLSEQGVQTSVHYPPAHRFSIYEEGAAELPVTDEYAARALTLPMFAHMTEDQVEIVTDGLRSGLLAAQPG
jgi:dTDP-4-amino-4,6-dideoxygalactose transaminase